MIRHKRVVVAGLILMMGGLAAGLLVQFALRHHLPTPAGTSAAATDGPDPSRGPAAAGFPPGSLQRLIDAAAPGSTVSVPAGIYRETVTIAKPLTLLGTGAEIRGSDLFATWTGTGPTWTSSGTVPPFPQNGNCVLARCAWPEQVMYDGRPLTQVAASPAPGEFGLDSQRHVVLADTPTGHAVEVTMRQRWLVVTADDVTADGLTFRDAADPPQSGGIEVDGVSRFHLAHATLTDAHGALLSISGGSGHVIADDSFARAGQLGIHLVDISQSTVSGVTVIDSNTQGFDPGWEAGGLKAFGVSDLVVADSTFSGNAGVGIWCDGGCHDADFHNNSVHDNTSAGIEFEISDGASISGNRVWANGFGSPDWAWGSGILISSSSHAVVSSNVVAWNADGINVISQARGGSADVVVGDAVHDNLIVLGPNTTGGDQIMLGWIQDPGLPSMFATTAANSDRDNLLWASDPDPVSCRYQWDGCMSSVTAMDAKGGDIGSHFLDQAHRDVLLTAAGEPLSPIE